MDPWTHVPFPPGTLSGCMTRAPTFEDIFATMSAASVGDPAARVALPDDPPIDDTATRLAIAVNHLLDDLTLRSAELERQVAEQTAELANVNEELEAFTYSVAHDLRAPLRAIDGFSQALLEDCARDLTDDGRKYLGLVRESARQMGRLIDDLLKLSRVTRSDLHRERVDLTALARKTVANLQRFEPNRRVEIVIEDGLVANADSQLLSIVLENLLGNAWKYTGKRPVGRVELRLQPESRPPTYVVRDNGAGFDMAYANKLFGVFQRLHSPHEFKGEGIGLATVKRIVRRHGGRVWAEGSVDGGARFYFTLEKESPR
jgi:light-regulated signal transduction histidine kinase (bacteriophytochrome)